MSPHFLGILSAKSENLLMEIFKNIISEDNTIFTIFTTIIIKTIHRAISDSNLTF